jgi:hypothetical protein
MGILKDVNDRAKVVINVDTDVETLSTYWNEHGTDMDTDAINSAVRNDLAQLEYMPDQIETIVPQIMDRVQK